MDGRCISYNFRVSYEAGIIFMHTRINYNNGKVQQCKGQDWKLAYATPVIQGLTLKAPITTAADDIHKYFFIDFFRENKT